MRSVLGSNTLTLSAERAVTSVELVMQRAKKSTFSLPETPIFDGVHKKSTTTL